MDKRSMFDITDKNLQKMAVPAVSMKAHQVQLKQALLAASRSKQTPTKTRWSNPVKYITTKPKFLIPGAVTAFAVLAVLAVSLFANMRPVSAAELTQQTLNNVSRLSPSDLQALDQHVNADPKAELEAAKNAKDLSIMTYDEFVKLSSKEPGYVAPPAGATDGADAYTKDLKYLRYTDSQGAVHTIAVDKSGLPVMIMVFKQNKDGSSEGSVQVGGNGSGQMSAGDINGQTSTANMPAGMIGCKAGSDGQPVCTYSDGSPAPGPGCTTTSDGGMMCGGSASLAAPKQ